MTKDSFQSQLHRFAERHAVDGVPPWTAGVAENEPDPDTRRSFAAPLGVLTWELDAAIMQETELFAAIYRLQYGPKVGLIRIWRYVHSPRRAEIFGNIIRRFEGSTDALLIDQQYNRGGSLLQMYAMCSYLTDRPLPVPLHQIKLWDNDVPEAKDVLERQQYGEKLPEEDRPSPWEIAWAQIVLEHAKFGEGVLSDPIPLFGISQIEPASHAYSKPIFLLSNGQTFSAGEFLAAILKDNRRAVLLGQNTAGAGGCVRTKQLNSKLGLESLNMTMTITWTVGWRRNGFIIENTGISPDIEISQTVEDLKSDHAQFKRGLCLLIAMALHEPKGISVLPELRDSRMRAK